MAVGSGPSELAFWAHQLRLQAELNESLGCASTPLPSLAPLQVSPEIRAQFEGYGGSHESPRTDSSRGPGPRLERAPRRPTKPEPGARSPQRESPRSAPAPVSRAGRAALSERGQPLGESAQALGERRTKSEADLAELWRTMAGCTKCALHEGRTRLVFGQGDAVAELCFVGEGPGAEEDRQGLAFVGPSGDLLSKMIQAMGLPREDAFICNVVKCRPPGNRAPQAAEMATCLPFLDRQLAIVKPRVIVALGKTAAVGLGLLKPRQGLGRNRGFHRWNGIPVMVTYHPAYLLRTPADKKLVWQDLKQVIPYLTRRPLAAGEGR